MEQIVSSWNQLKLRRKIAVGAATAIMFASLIFMAQFATRPSLALLYANLDDIAASDVLTALEQRGVVHEVRGKAIFVDASQKDALRLDLAGEGLPSNGPEGYELLDTLNGFGTTSQMFDAAYWRAKEGELARTILASPGITSARVHIARTTSSVFARNQELTASVFVQAPTGRPEPGAVRAIQHLVASGVANLEPTAVSVMDPEGLLTAQEPETAAANSAVDLSAVLKERVTRLLEARVGKDNVVVEVSVDTNNQTESITERRFDPEGRVAISTDTEERSRNVEGSNSNLSVASNLPDGEANQSEGSTTADTESRERVNYEVSETRREINRLPGEVERLTVAVLVNGTTTENDDGTQQFQPIPEAEIAALKGLVASAIGFNEARGDEITIHSLEFDQEAIAGTAALAMPWYYEFLDIGALAKIALSGILALVLGAFVIRPLLQSARPENRIDLPALEPMDDGPAIEKQEQVPDPEEQPQDLPMLFPDTAFFETEFGDDEQPQESPVENLKALIESRKDETVEVLSQWLDAPEKAST